MAISISVFSVCLYVSMHYIIKEWDIVYFFWIMTSILGVDDPKLRKALKHLSLKQAERTYSTNNICSDTKTLNNITSSPNDASILNGRVFHNKLKTKSKSVEKIGSDSETLERFIEYGQQFVVENKKTLQVDRNNYHLQTASTQTVETCVSKTSTGWEKKTGGTSSHHQYPNRERKNSSSENEIPLTLNDGHPHNYNEPRPPDQKKPVIKKQINSQRMSRCVVYSLVPICVLSEEYARVRVLSEEYACVRVLSEEYACVRVLSEEYACVRVFSEEYACVRVRSEEYACVRVLSEEYACVRVRSEEYARVRVLSEEYACVRVLSEEYACVRVRSEEYACVRVLSEEYACVRVPSEEYACVRVLSEEYACVRVLSEEYACVRVLSEVCVCACTF